MIIGMAEITRILEAVQQGDLQAAAELFPLVYEELRKVASQKMAHEAPGPRSNPRSLSMKPGCGWRAARVTNGKTELTSLAPPSKPCGASWSSGRGDGNVSSAAATGSGWNHYYCDWILAHVLLREAKALIEGPAHTPANQPRSGVSSD
jgi:hypothetical protein